LQAGTGIDAETFAQILIQYRGLTWTTGGDEELTNSITIPSEIKIIQILWKKCMTHFAVDAVVCPSGPSLIELMKTFF